MSTGYEIAIIGAGFAGIGAGMRLRMQGDTSFVIFEKAQEVGGTWRDNTYPGCACDIPSFLYSYSFEPNPNWNYTFSPQSEILKYLKYCADKYELNKYIRFNTEIAVIKFDETQGLWLIADQHDNLTTARIVISGAGPLNAPFIPHIKGKEKFAGASWHSQHWNHEYNLTGKKVAVIGTGASAIQFVPQIAPDLEQLFVFQRSAPWIAPKPNKKFSDTAKLRLKKYPGYQKFWREYIYWYLENRGRSLYSKNRMQKKRTKEALAHLNNSISDPELKKKLIPDYELGCKRVLISEDYYPTLERKNVDLITDAVYRTKINLCNAGQHHYI